MSKILIVGAGQAGLQLGLGLLVDGHEVTVVSNRTGEEIRSGRVMSGQLMFDTALQTERELGINFWEQECPNVAGVSMAVAAPGGDGKAVDWAGRFDHHGQSVDQRVKMPGWMDELERRGGKLVIHDVGVADLERYTENNDLVIVAAGKGEIARLFARDPERSPYARPMRELALTYVTGMNPRPDFAVVSFNLIPGVGECFILPTLTTSGARDIIAFEAIPGGPMDIWGETKTPKQHLADAKKLLETFLPWEAERCTNIELTDENGILAGRLTPTVRKPVAELPNGRLVLGLADVVMLNDPLSGQGSNNAAKMATAYLAAIRRHGDAPYDRRFLELMFEDFWQDYGQYPTGWTNALLSPLPQHVIQLLAAGNDRPEIVRRFAAGFDSPAEYFDWLMFPDRAEAYLEELDAAAHLAAAA